MRHRWMPILLLLAAIAFSACSSKEGCSLFGPDPVVLVVAYGSEKKTWLEEQVKNFEATQPKSKKGRPIRIDARAMGSGEAVTRIVSGDVQAHVFSPAASIYIPMLNRAWQALPGKTKPLSPEGEPVLLSPLVVAMWKPMAEALGWPGKSVGWADILRISADPAGWGSIGHPEWGRFKLGHTHPEYSNSGLLSVLAMTCAGAKKTRDLTVADVDSKPVVDLIHTIEQSVVHYGKSTGFFADKMLSRGPAYLSATVLYENLIIESYNKPSQAPFPLVAVYPAEGTFWADHPYAILDAEWVGPEEREAAEAFLAFLKQRPQQERALALGFRPADPAVHTGAPIDAAHGVDPLQPKTLLEIPKTDVLDRVISLWQTTKKPSDIILVFDRSGSMDGTPLEQAKAGAKRFLTVLHGPDEVTVLSFDDKVDAPFGPQRIGEGSTALGARIDQIEAGGGTALYDALASAYKLAEDRARAAPDRIHAVMVMTDGSDSSSDIKLDDLLKRFTAKAGKEEEAPVKVFTIAYGDADADVLGKIAEAGRGSSSTGKTDTIVQVYMDMASFF